MDERNLGRAAREDAQQLRSLKVLVLDEQAITRQVLTLLLDWAGANVTCAETLSEALAFLSVRRFDAILTDAELPGESLRAGRRVLAVAGPNAGAPILRIDGVRATEPAHAAGMMVEIGSLIDPARICHELAGLVPPPRVAA
jgi:CheY-like chemotaxis protein